jgi:Glycosyltransferase like family 2
MTREMPSELDCTYLLPFRRAAFDPAEAAKLRYYFDKVGAAGCEIILIDGSPPEVFAQNKSALGDACRHEPVDRRYRYLNDKVNGVHTGVALASCEKIILADDDIRYGAEQIREIRRLLDTHEVVRPQNFLRPLPWWAKMEAARMLINRATLRAADYPGTCAFRRSVFLARGHYDGDVLFDNEELIRHLAQHGCTIAYANDLFVRKRPPSFRKWIEQRPRQAYEDFGMRTKTALFFGLPWLLIATALRFDRRGIPGFIAAISLGSIFIAWRGRARGKAIRFFPLRCCFCAPLWVAERTLSTYWALYCYVVFGGYPFGDRLLSKGIGRAWWSGARAASVQLRHASK